MGTHGLDILQERGFIKQCTDIDSLRAYMDRQPITFYIGVDPTGRSLHIGHMVPFFAMAHLQRAGHMPIAVMGVGTALIGDPSGKTEMRMMLPLEQIEQNLHRIKAQLARVVEFGEHAGIMVNNYDWLGDLNYLEFLRDIGRHFSVNRMLSFESYKQRLEKGLSFIEFNYQLLQSYDYLKLFQQYGCRLQMGGDDQWGNIVAGMELIRRMEGETVYGLTFPLVTRSDGQKMGKSEKGAVFLDPEMFAPYDFYQYWRNVSDADVIRFLKFFTFLPMEQIREMEQLTGADLNRAKELLAWEQTCIIHGEEEAKRAREAAQAAFSNSSASSSAIPSITVERSELVAGIGVLDLFARTDLCASRGEARRLVMQGGARINDRLVSQPETVIDADWLEDHELLLRAGKKRYFRIVCAF